MFIKRNEKKKRLVNDELVLRMDKLCNDSLKGNEVGNIVKGLLDEKVVIQKNIHSDESIDYFVYASINADNPFLRVIITLDREIRIAYFKDKLLYPTYFHDLEAFIINYDTAFIKHYELGDATPVYLNVLNSCYDKFYDLVTEDVYIDCEVDETLKRVRSK